MQYYNSILLVKVEYTGVEPVTSALRTQRSGQLS